LNTIYNYTIPPGFVKLVSSECEANFGSDDINLFSLFFLKKGSWGRGYKSRRDEIFVVVK